MNNVGTLVFVVRNLFIFKLYVIAFAIFAQKLFHYAVEE